MAIFLRAAIFAIAAGMLAAGSQADAAKLRSVRVTETPNLPVIQPGWAIPAEPNQQFYLQRSSNANTVVYTARFDENGNLHAKKPIQVYWRRYNTTGERKALKPIEQRFAYGVNVKPRQVSGEFSVTLKPLPEMQMILRQTGPGRAELIATVGGRDVQARYAYVSVDETGLIPRVTGLSVHGIDMDTGKAVSEYFTITGGIIRQ